MKKPALLGMILLSLGAILLLIYVTTYLSNNYLTSKNSGIDSRECTAPQTNHLVTIKGDQMTPNRVEAAFCDKLTVFNKDGKLRSISFGEHYKHISYDGVTEAILAQNESLTVELNKTGNFIFHDHYQQSVKASFLVKQKPLNWRN